MLTRAAVVTVFVSSLAACTGQQKPVNVSLDNQSSVPLEVEVDLPSRGMFGKKPNHEAFRMLLPAGAKWQNTPDTLRFGAEPNDVKGFRIWAADNSQAERVWYKAFTVEGSRKECHLVFKGSAGELVWASAGGGGEHAMELWTGGGQ